MFVPDRHITSLLITCVLIHEAIGATQENGNLSPLLNGSRDKSAYDFMAITGTQGTCISKQMRCTITEDSDPLQALEITFNSRAVSSGDS
jgi:hypothetical protein